MTKLPFEVHPAAEIFPLIKGRAFAELVEDIRENGVKEPIVFWKGKLIDGRNRAFACMSIGLDPLDRACDVEDESFDPISYVLSANLHRRHLSETEREVLAAKIATLKHGTNRHTKVDPPNGGSKSVNEAAEQLNVKPRSVERAKTALKGGCEPLVEMLESGEVKSSTAANFVKAVPDKKEQQRICKQGVGAIKEAVKEAKSEPRRAKIDAAEPAKEAKSERAPLPELVVAFRRSASKANDLRALVQELDQRFRVLLAEFLKESSQ